MTSEATDGCCGQKDSTLEKPAPSEAAMKGCCQTSCSQAACNAGSCDEEPCSKGASPPFLAVEVPAEADARKAEGNAAFQAKNYQEAIRLYSEAQSIAEASGAPVPGVYFSNRAVCRASLGDWAGARTDATEAISRLTDPAAAATKKAFFQKARAEVRLQLYEDLQATLKLAAEKGLREEVEHLLLADSRSAAPQQAQSQTPQAAPVQVETRSPEEQAAGHKEAGTAKYKEGAYREALTEYRRALDVLPADATLRATLLGNVAAACLMLRRAEECISACEESLALDASNAKVRARLSTAQMAAGDFSLARATLEAGDMADTALVNAEKQISSSEASLADAEKAIKAGEPAKALSMYADLESKVLFNYPPLMLKMGRCYLELKQYPRVLNTTQQILRGNPRNIDALVLRTEALYRNHSAGAETKQWVEPLEQGQRLLKEALSFDPDHSDAQGLRKRLRQLCTMHADLKENMDSREFEQGMQVIDGMLQNCQDNPAMMASLYTERAKAGMRLKDWRSVLKDVGQATYRNHSLVPPYLYRAQALQALERFDDAVKELESLFSWHRVEAVYNKLEEAKFMLRKHKRTNYYELLNVPSVASSLEIKKAYREKAAEWHPDKKGHLDEEARKNAEEMFKCIGEAYEVLMDAAKKELFDKGYDLEGINEQIELKKRRTHGGCCHGGGCH